MAILLPLRVVPNEPELPRALRFSCSKILAVGCFEVCAGADRSNRDVHTGNRSEMEMHAGPFPLLMGGASRAQASDRREQNGCQSTLPATRLEQQLVRERVCALEFGERHGASSLSRMNPLSTSL